jgi:ATP-binding cassette subfamily C protein LapB
MDESAERAALEVLQRQIAPDHTLVLVTHKPQLLALVDRVVVLTETGIALDGPRAAVLHALAQNGAAQRPLKAAA